jgi:hypothetical protein
MSMVEPPRQILADGDVARKVPSSRQIADELIDAVSEMSRRNRIPNSPQMTGGRATFHS